MLGILSHKNPISYVKSIYFFKFCVKVFLWISVILVASLLTWVISSNELL